MSIEGVRAGTRRPSDFYWFTPKHHGYGAVPRTWQGWVATIAFSLAIGLSTAAVMIALRGSQTVVWHVLWCAVILVAVWRFSVFARVRTDGEWLWRYKGEPYRKMIETKENSAGNDGVGSPDRRGASPPMT